MATIDQIMSLMSQVGPILDPLTIDFFGEQQSWAVVIEEDLVVFVDFDEGKNSLVLSIDLGEPATDNRNALYEKLLQMNYHFDVTGGTRMAIDGPGGNVVQIYETPADGPDATELNNIVLGFTDVAKAWREIIRDNKSTQDNSMSAQDNSMSAWEIRNST